MTNVFVAGDVTFNSLIYLDQFPQPKPQTVFSAGFHETVGVQHPWNWVDSDQPGAVLAKS